MQAKLKWDEKSNSVLLLFLQCTFAPNELKWRQQFYLNKFFSAIVPSQIHLQHLAAAAASSLGDVISDVAYDVITSKISWRRRQSTSRSASSSSNPSSNVSHGSATSHGLIDLSGNKKSPQLTVCNFACNHSQPRQLHKSLSSWFLYKMLYTMASESRKQ